MNSEQEPFLGTAAKTTTMINIAEKLGNFCFEGRRKFG